MSVSIFIAHGFANRWQTGARCRIMEGGQGYWRGGSFTHLYDSGQWFVRRLLFSKWGRLGSVFLVVQQ